MEATEPKVNIEFEDLPDKDDAEFSDLVQLPSPNYKTATLPVESHQKPQQTTTRRPAPYVSFGDRGTTASASVYGSFLRICRPVQKNHLLSGMVGLGLPDDPEAWYIYWRASQFLENAQLPTSGFGLRILDPLSVEPPTVEFLGDRWPAISYRTSGSFAVTVRLWCQRNIVMQQMRITDQLFSNKLPKIEFSPAFSMQDLDYLDRRENLKVQYSSAPHSYGIVTMEQNSDFGIERERICVLTGLFKNGHAQELTPDLDTREIKHDFENSRTVEYTAVFKLQMSAAKANWKSFMISRRDFDFDPRTAPSLPDIETSFPFDQDLNWHLRRNLEHVLSVCSIPLNAATLEKGPMITVDTPDGKEEILYQSASVYNRFAPAALGSGDFGDDQVSESGSYGFSKLMDKGPMIMLNSPDGSAEVLHRSAPVHDRFEPVALTSGDFGDHRVTVSGSYFAFTFLLEMHERLPSSKAMRSRIHAICKGHLEWVSQLDASDACSSNVSVYGKRMDETEETDLPYDLPANMPTHIIKATQYVQVFPDIDDLLFICSWLGKFVVEWFRQLAKTKNHLTSTWPHLDDTEIPEYRLSDHVWIWRALKSIEDLIQRVKMTQDKMPNETLGEFLQTTSSHLPRRGVRKPSRDMMLDFTADELRRQNLRQFTLDNDVLKRRMLSVTRTARETRFLLHSRGTVLYYGLEWGFFAGEETVWKQLVNAQIHHDEAGNDEAQWDNPLRYGLALEMARKGHQLERTFSPTEMLAHAKRVILNSSSENGLFPGQLDAFSKEPMLFLREFFRDFYFHVGFEIPYILLRTLEKPVPSQSQSIGASNDDSQEKTSGVGQRIPSIDDRDASVQDKPRDLSFIPDASNTGALHLNFQADGRAVAIKRTLKRQNPYGRLIDLNNIVEIPEEWLYKYPEFLDFASPTDSKEIDLIQDGAPHKIKEAMQDSQFRSMIENSMIIDNAVGQCYATIDDVRKGRKQRKWSFDEKSESDEHPTYTSLWERLKQRRSAEDSKKRLVYLRFPDYPVAAMCYIASPDSERVYMSQFFDRHAKVHANYFYDDTAAVFNIWVTEVHIRFFQLFKPRDSEPLSRDVPPVRQLWSQSCGILGRDAHLVDAVSSFRIVGDFFDRYWTCHVLQSFADTVELDKSPPLSADDRRQSADWQQRRVLELILLNHILDKVYSSVRVLLRHIEKGPRLSASDAGEKYFSRDGFEDRTPVELHESFQLLVILKDNITSLQGLIEQWNCRESSQGRERPRWTRNDEQKYRKAIKQRLAHFESHVRQIKATMAHIEFLIALVTNAQDAIRSNKSLREAQNITLFTYVTVFFLPVGLAVSIFSMSGTPERSTIVRMIITAIVALLITICVLWFAVNHLGTIRTHISRVFRSDQASKKVAEDNPGRPGGMALDQRLRQRLTFGHKDQKTDSPTDDLESQTTRGM